MNGQDPSDELAERLWRHPEDQMEDAVIPDVSTAARSDPNAQGNKRPRSENSHTNDYAELIKQTVGERIPVEIMSKIGKIAKALGDDIMKLQKLKSRIAKMTDDVQKLAAGEFPAGVRPYKSFADPFLEGVYTVEDKVVTIKIAAGATMNEAKRTIYHSTQLLLKQIDLEAAQKK